MRRILVIRGGALGDFILTLPALAALRTRWRAADIELLGYPRITCLATMGQLVQRLHSLDTALFAGLFVDAPPSPELAEFLGGFDLIISYLYDPSGCVLRALQASGRRVVCGSPMITDGHAADVLMGPLTELGIPWTPPAVPVLVWGRDASPRLPPGAEIERGVVVVHAGSGSSRKNWPLEQFIDLARRLQGRLACRCVFTIGEADAAVEAGLSSGEFECWKGLSLPELAVRLRGCIGYVGNDSGVSHLAAAVGTPVVAIFSATDPALWAPRGPGVAIVQGKALDLASAEAVAAACQGFFV